VQTTKLKKQQTQNTPLGKDNNILTHAVETPLFLQMWFILLCFCYCVS